MSHQSFANSFSFFAQFSYNDKILKYYLQSVKLPDVITGEIVFQKKGKHAKAIGDSKELGTIPLEFILDENWDVYTTLLDIQENYRKTLKTIDAFEIYIQNNKNVNILKFVFDGVFFVNVMGPQLDTRTQETTVIVPVDISFFDWRIERL